MEAVDTQDNTPVLGKVIGQEGLFEAVLYLFTRSDLFTSICEAYQNGVGVLSGDSALSQTYQHSAGLLELIGKITKLQRNKFDSTEIYRYLKQENSADESPLTVFLATLSIVFRIEHLLEKIPSDFPGITISSSSDRMSAVKKELFEVANHKECLEPYGPILQGLLYKATAAFKSKKNPKPPEKYKKVMEMLDGLVAASKPLRPGQNDVNPGELELRCNKVFNELKKFIYDEKFLAYNLGISSDPIANMMCHAICSYFTEDLGLNQENYNGLDDTLFSMREKLRELTEYRSFTFCSDFDLPKDAAFQLERFYLKNSMYINHISFQPNLTRSCDKTLGLYFSVYGSQDSVWGFGSDHLYFKTDALKKVTFNSGQNVTVYEEQRAKLQQAVLKITFGAVFKQVYNSISEDCLDLEKLPKCVFYMEGENFYMIDDMEASLGELPNSRYCAMVAFNSPFHLNRAKTPEGLLTMITCCNRDAREGVWLPYFASTGTTLLELMEFLMKNFIGEHKRSVRSKSGIRQVNQDLQVSYQDILPRLRFSMKRETLTTKLTEAWTHLNQALKITDINQTPGIRLEDILKVLISKDPNPSHEVRNSKGFLRVKLICMFDVDFEQGQNDHSSELFKMLQKNLMQDKTNAEVSLNERQKLNQKLRPVELTNVDFLARVQPVKELKLFPKLSDFMQAMLEYDSSIPGDQFKQFEDHFWKPPENKTSSCTQKSRAGLGFHQIFLPNMYVMDVSGMDCIDVFADFILDDLKHLEEDDKIFVSVRYRPIGMIFRSQKEAAANKELKSFYNVVEICTDNLETMRTSKSPQLLNLFEKECIRSKIISPNKKVKTNGLHQEDQEIEAPFDPASIKLDEIQRTRLVTYFKYHGSTFDPHLVSLRRETVQYWLPGDFQLTNYGLLNILLFERIPVQ